MTTDHHLQQLADGSDARRASGRQPGGDVAVPVGVAVTVTDTEAHWGEADWAALELDRIEVAIAHARIEVADDHEADDVARSTYAALCQRASAGDTSVTSDEFAAAKQVAELAALRREARVPALIELQEELNRAHQGILNAEVRERWPVLSGAIEKAWQDIDASLAALRDADEAARLYRRTVEQRVHFASNDEAEPGGGYGRRPLKVGGLFLSVDPVSDRLNRVSREALAGFLSQMR
jgi:hypothetical protein